MLNIESKYITADDYKQIKGIDLAIELVDDDNKSNKVNRFIKDITDWCCRHIAQKYGVNELNPNLEDQWPQLPSFRRNQFKLGVIEQIEYVLNNGLISQDSGISKETGQILDYSRVVLGQNAYNCFWLGAFCNIKRSGASYCDDEED